MKTKKSYLPGRSVTRVYRFRQSASLAILGATSPCSDPTTTCGTVFTTTHLQLR